MNRKKNGIDKSRSVYMTTDSASPYTMRGEKINISEGMKSLTVFQEVFQVLNRVKPQFWLGGVCANEREDVVGENVRICIGAEGEEVISASRH